jgi:hypothetical protein
MSLSRIPIGGHKCLTHTHVLAAPLSLSLRPYLLPFSLLELRLPYWQAEQIRTESGTIVPTRVLVLYFLFDRTY